MQDSYSGFRVIYGSFLKSESTVQWQHGCRSRGGGLVMSDLSTSIEKPTAASASKPPPRLRGGLPLLGHALAFGRDPLDLLSRGYAEHGEVFEFLMAGSYFVMCAGPQAHDSFFRAPETQLSAREVYKFTVPIFGRGVAYDVESDRMAEQLGFLFPSLRDGEMQRYAGIMQHEAEHFVSGWGEEGVIDLPAATNALTVNVASRCLLGAEIRDRLDNEFASLFHDLQGGINTLGFFAPHLPTPRHKRRDRARREFSRLVAGILENRRLGRVHADDFMQGLIDASYRDGTRLSDEEITGLLLTVLFAGQHTSAVLAAWTLIELIRNPDYLTRVRREFEKVYANDKRLTLQSLKRQTVLDNAVRECERMHPPLIILIRKVKEDFCIGSHLIPAGRLAAVSPLLSHRLPTVFSDPHTWDPTRFEEPRAEHKRHTHTLIGFGGGKHRCMGMHFAYLQIKALLTVLLREHAFEIIGSQPLPDYKSWVTGPRRPCSVRFRRQANS